MGPPILLASLLLAAPAWNGEAAVPGSWRPTEGNALIGTPAPEWKGVEWIQGEPTTLADLRGQVVLVRFWLMDCSYCARTAPALRDLSKRYGDRGLAVVGLHHPKSDSARDPKAVARAARLLDLPFRIGLDNDWQTIRAYGVGTVFKQFTSVTFLIDRRGLIRFVHDGGEFHEGGGPDHAECNAAYRALEAAVTEALKGP